MFMLSNLSFQMYNLNVTYISCMVLLAAYSWLDTVCQLHRPALYCRRFTQKGIDVELTPFNDNARKVDDQYTLPRLTYGKIIFLQ